MRETLQPYEKYRDSGFQWLGEIPNHWEVKKFNHIADIVEGQVDPKEKPYQDYVLVAPNHIESGTGRLICQETALEQGAISGKYLFQSGDIVYSKIRPALRKVWKADFPGICSADMYPIRLSKKKIDPAYFTFLCLSESFSGFMIATSMRVAMPKVNRDDFHECHFIIPPISEQKTIAHYLDTKTAQIDRKIDLLTQKAQRYEELKRSLINETVTRGLDKSVPMKDSAIDWIGEIPEHWQEKRIKDLSFLQSGINITSEQIEDEGEYPVYGGNGIRGYFSDYTNDGSYILIGRQGALCGNINHASGKFWATEHAVVVYHKKEIDMRWYRAMLQVMNLNQYSISAAQPGLAVDRVKRLLLPVPPFEEQKVIAEYLDKKTTHIDQVVANINSQIEIQKELRKTLINDVVTGKIKVA